MKVYVVVRKDLRLSSSAVQAGHALAELCLNHDLVDWATKHRTLVYLKASDEKMLLETFDNIRIKEKAIFQEPDLGNEFTAFAVLAKENEYSFFKGIPLL